MDADKHRERIREILETKTFPHQRYAAKNAFAALDVDCRTVIVAAEMQSGKSGVALSLACYQRNSLADADITNIKLLKDTMYVLTMADTALLTQAKEDLKPCHNAVVSNLTHFENDILSKFTHTKPKLIIVDECHYGSSDKAVRYEKLFSYIEEKNPDCSVIFISATPLSALLAAEDEAILRRNLKTKLVFHKASDDYHGIRQMLQKNQVIGLGGKEKNIMNRSEVREQFFNKIKDHSSAGWALMRVPSGAAMNAKELLIKNGFDASDIFIIGRSLSGVPEHELIGVENFKNEYEQAMLFGRKLIAVTVAGVRAGINFGQEMKENLIASWDSTVSSIAAIVQANIGRACGYHQNHSALHFTNKHGVKAYADIVNFLEQNCSSHATDDLSGLREEFERICGAHEIRGLDVGARVNSGNSKSFAKIANYKAYETDSYLVVPGKLTSRFDFTKYTDDPELLDTIDSIRSIMQKKGPSVGKHSMPPKSNVIASWVNGDTFDNPEKAIAGGPAFQRVSNLIVSLDKELHVRFNDIIPAGGGIDPEKNNIAAYIFSIFNESSRKVEKRVMTQADVDDVSSAFFVEPDDTIIVLFKRGDENIEMTNSYINDLIEKSTKSKIVEANKFQRL